MPEINTGYTLVQLTPAEVAFALSLATQRDACKPETNRSSRISRTHSAFGVHFAGVVGEICFRKVHGGKINQDILSGGDGHRGDVVVCDGRPVEIKTCLFTGPDVEMKFEKEELCHIRFCSLVQLFMPDVAKVSDIWSMSAIGPMIKTKNYGHGDRHIFSPGPWN